MTATTAAARVGRAGAVLGAGGLASSVFVMLRMLETWRVTPVQASHRISVLGQKLTYPAANLGAVIVVALALLGLAVTGMIAAGAARELAADRRLRRRLDAHRVHGCLPGAHRGARVIEDARPRAFCAGLIRPHVYVSSGALALLDDNALGAVLAHELAHARRRDPLRLACGRVLARALFYVPGLGELHRHQQALSELSADEHAVAAAPANRAGLARAMLSFSEHSRPDDPTGIDPERVDHLLGDPPSWRFPVLLWGLGLGVLGLLGGVGVLAGRVAAGSATLAVPFLSRQPCVVMLAVVPAALGVGALRLRRGLAGRLAGGPAGHLGRRPARLLARRPVRRLERRPRRDDVPS
ncbi:MAG: M56 family metallopeptidase [Solirubrobacterales bacterium]|nr:M56 family metallopeptidase [Solirubrobacterales bacterium]